MVDRTAKYDGLALITETMDHNNFTVTNADNLEYIPSPDGGYAQLKIDAEGGSYPLWKSIEYMSTVQQTGGYYSNLLTAGQSDGSGTWAVCRGTTVGAENYTNILAANVANGTDTSSNTTGWLAGGTTPPTIGSSTEQKYAGSRSLKMTSTSLTGGDQWVDPFTADTGSMNGMTANRTYTASAYIYVPTATGLNPTHTRGLKLVFFYKNSSGTYIETASAKATQLDQWERLQVTVTIPTGATEAFVRCYSGFATSGKVTYWDQLSVTMTSDPNTPYIAGTSSAASVTSTSSTTWSHAGTKSTKATCYGYSDGEGQYITVNVSPNTEYTFQCYTYAASGTDYKVLIHNHADTTTPIYDSGTITSTGAEVQTNQTFTTDASTSIIRITIRNTLMSSYPKNYGDIYVDAAMLNIGPYYDWIQGGTTENWAPDLEMYTELYGVNESGNIEFIGEILDSVDNPPQTTAVTTNNMFDLLGSACRSKFIKLSTTGTIGKIYLNLPMRTQYFEEFNLEILTYTGWTRRKTVAITGQDGGGISNQVQEVTVPYDSDMASDYSDIIVTNASDTATVPFCIIRKASGTSVTLGIQLSSGPADGAVQYYHVWYKKAGATSTAVAPSTLYTYFDDFEDGLLTGRTSPYLNWTNQATPAMVITPSSVFSGTYSAQITSPSSATRSCTTISESSTSFSVDYDYKVKYKGGGSSAPWHSFYLRWVSSSEFVCVDFYYDTSYAKQYCKLNVNGTTIDARVVGSRWITNDTAKIHIADTGSHVYVYVNDYIVLSTDYTSTSAQTKKGFGTYSSTDIAVFDNLRISPLLIQAATTSVGSEIEGKYGGTETTSETASDAKVDDTKQVTFTTPTLTSGSQGYIEYQEKGKGPLNSDKMTITDGMIINQGYNSLDAYKSLILKFNVKGEYYSVSIDRVTARYEV